MTDLRTALEGHDETLEWRDFTADPPKNRAATDVALTQTRFNLLYDYSYEKAQGTHHGYRVDHVNAQVILDRSKMWAASSGRTPGILRHEQGHFDIVALTARDLYNELTGWDSSDPPRRFRKDTDLKSAVDRLRRQALRFVEFVAPPGGAAGIYDTQTDHGRKTAAQDKWNEALAAARLNKVTLKTALSGLGVGAPP